jgi:hypothetical protein
MNGNCWLGGVRCRLVGVFIDHLDGEELLVDCLVAVSEKFITTETFTVFLAQGDFGWSESDGAQRWFIDRGSPDAAGASDAMVEAEDGTGLYEDRLGARDDDREAVSRDAL